MRYERIHTNAKPIRTKGRISRWTTACKVVFEKMKINPQLFKFKAGSYFFFIDKSQSILIAEIIAIFVVSLFIKLSSIKQLVIFNY